MLSDQVIKSIPVCNMIRDARILSFITENTKSQFFLSAITVNGTFKLLEFPTLQMANDYTTQFINVTSSTIVNYFSDMEGNISKNVLDATAVTPVTTQVPGA